MRENDFDTHSFAYIVEYENTTKMLSENLTDKSFLNSEQLITGNKLFFVVYVPKKTISPCFGNARGNVIKVRADLSPRVKKFVKQHELYHCIDKATWGGWIGREIRANIIPGFKDPLGLLATIKASFNKERLKFYWERFKRAR